MAGRINDEDVKAVRNAVPIDAVVSEYLQLRSAGGGQLKGLCPFHDEKSPSFHVSPSKGFYHCFGCQEGGDTLDFVMKVDHLSFSEAVERLAAQAGITLRYEEGGYGRASQAGERTRLVEAHRSAAAFYREQLESAEAETGRKFLAARGFDQDAAQHFGVGYAPAGWDHLVRFLRGKGFTDKEILAAGLAQESRNGRPIDRFRGRLMWPIRDITGEVVGFGARKLRDDDNGPKYLNTPETPLFHKSQVLYGIDLAKREIGRAGRAVVVEGYTDVMACHLAGVTGAIATCGTSFGGDHVKILRRVLMDSWRSEVVFTFDGDAAGQKAALRAFEDDQKFAARTSIAITPGGMDPCELRLAEGDGAVQELVESRTPLFEFAIRSVTRQYPETPEGQAAALEEGALIVARIKDDAVRHKYAVLLSGLLGYVTDNQSAVRHVATVARRARARGGARQEPAAAPAPQGHPAAPAGPAHPGPAHGGPALNLRSPARLVERELLKLALQRPELVAPAFDAYGADEFTAPPYAVVRQTIGAAGGVTDADGEFVARVRDAAPDDTVRSLATELAVEPLRSAKGREPDEVYAGMQLVAVRLAAVHARIADLEASARRLEAQRDQDRAAPVREQLWVLQRYARELRDRGPDAL